MCWRQGQGRQGRCGMESFRGIYRPAARAAPAPAPARRSSGGHRGYTALKSEPDMSADQGGDERFPGDGIAVASPVDEEDKERDAAEPMDNAAFERDAHGEAAQRGMTTVELGELGSRPNGRTPAPTASVEPRCRTDLCRARAPQILGKSPTVTPNPWHRYKTVLLVATIAGLVIWAVVYGLFASKWQGS
ncbi:Protein FAM160A1 [Frankliniella fusca]|uniref:Protein FAM160A1 n=1 Tax=Frankliniella fusca TaxID=407009 RepID=A0AAE1H332_9NEOP|nr:Protein FAM160A1 [Frankliniella fusca]